MGDTSQSRYSIVERLTQTKLDLLKAIDDQSGDVGEAQVDVRNAETRKAVWESRLDSEIKRTRAKHETEIDAAKEDLAVAEAGLKQKRDLLDKQLKVVDDALNRIEEISKTAQAL